MNYMTLVRRLENAPSNKPVLCYRNEEITASAFLDLIAGFVEWLSDRGVAHRHLGGLLAPNRPEAIAARYAPHLLGAATSYLSSPSKPEARLQLIDDIAPDLLLA